MDTPEAPYDRACAHVADTMSPRVQKLKPNEVADWAVTRLIAVTFNTSVDQVVADIVRLHKPHDPEPVTTVTFTHDQIELLLDVVTNRIITLDKTHQRSNSRTKFRLIDKIVQLREIEAKLT